MTSKGLAFIAMALFLSATIAVAQGQKGMRNYDPATETTLKGTVDQVKQVAGRHGWNGTHLLVKTDAGLMEVHVGPASYVESQGFSFAAGDQVEVLGSKIKLGNADALIAREIRKGDKTLVLRNAQGIPQWAGGRRPAN